MTEAQTERNTGATWRFPIFQIVLFIILTGWNAWYSFISDFFKGPMPAEISAEQAALFGIDERLQMFGFTEVGPLAFLFLDLGPLHYVLSVFSACLIVGALVLVTLFPRKIGLELLGFISVALWFLLGHCAAHLRIT